MDDDVCHDRRCWASLDGHFVGDALSGGRMDATTWPVQPNQALDVWFNKSTDPEIGTWDAGYFRGVVDKASKPSAKGIQTLEVDYPDTMTSGELGSESPTLLPRLPAALTTGAFAFHPWHAG